MTTKSITTAQATASERAAIRTDLGKRTTNVATVENEFVQLTKATLDAITAIARGTRAEDRKRHGICRGHIWIPQIEVPASVYAATYPQRRHKALAQARAAADHLIKIGRKRPARALLRQAAETWPAMARGQAPGRSRKRPSAKAKASDAKPGRHAARPAEQTS